MFSNVRGLYREFLLLLRFRGVDDFIVLLLLPCHFRSGFDED